MKKALSLILSVLMIFSLTTVAFAAVETTEKPFENSNFYTDGEYTLHYRTYKPTGIAKNRILLIHGFCLSTASLEGIAEEYMKAGYEVVTLDAPNFGYSSRETTETVLRPREEVIYSLVKSLGGKWIVGGHSMGGGIALNLAAMYPETFTGLVLFAPQTNSEVSGIMKTLISSVIMRTMYTVILKIALMLPPVVRMLVEQSFSDSEYAKTYDLKRITAPLSVDGTGAGIAIMASHVTATDFDAVAALDIPAVVITGTDDRVAVEENLTQIITALGEDVVTYECEKGGHMMMEYNPQLVAEKTLPTIALCK